MSIEEKISELLDNSRKLNEEVDQEQIAEENLDEANGESMNKLEGDGAHPDNENNKKNAVVDQKSAANATTKKANVADKGKAGESMNKLKEEEEVSDEVIAEEQDEFKVDVSEDVAALVNGEELSEEFKSKAATIFEAAVISRVKQEVSKLEESYEQKLAEAQEEIQEGLVEKVDGYLGLMVEQWMEQNALALESGMKSEILEGFIGGLKSLFEEHYIDIPEEKYDVLGEMESKVEELESKLNESVESSLSLKKELDAIKRSQTIEETAEGLTDTEVEKFKGLAEELSYEDVESFNKKLQTIRENYFVKKATADVKSVVSDEPVAEQKVLSETMNRYSQALGKTTFFR
jgi:hypothetical protein